MDELPIRPDTDSITLRLDRWASIFGKWQGAYDLRLTDNERVDITTLCTEAAKATASPITVERCGQTMITSVWVVEDPGFASTIVGAFSTQANARRFIESEPGDHSSLVVHEWTINPGGND